MTLKGLRVYRQVNSPQSGANIGANILIILVSILVCESLFAGVGGRKKPGQLPNPQSLHSTETAGTRVDQKGTSVSQSASPQPASSDTAIRKNSVSATSDDEEQRPRSDNPAIVTDGTPDQRATLRAIRTNEQVKCTIRTLSALEDSHTFTRASEADSSRLTLSPSSIPLLSLAFAKLRDECNCVPALYESEINTTQLVSTPNPALSGIDAHWSRLVSNPPALVVKCPQAALVLRGTTLSVALEEPNTTGPAKVKVVDLSTRTGTGLKPIPYVVKCAQCHGSLDSLDDFYILPDRSKRLLPVAQSLGE